MEVVQEVLKTQNENAIHVHRDSYMSAYVLLDLLNKSRKRSNVRLAEYFIGFSNELNKFSNT